MRTLGVTPWVDLACLPARSMEDAGEHQLGRVIDRRAGELASVIFVLPAPFDLNIWQRTMLGEELGAARRRHAGVSIHHDSVDPTASAARRLFCRSDPAGAGRAGRRTAECRTPPGRRRAV